MNPIHAKQRRQYDAAHALAARNGTSVGRWPEDARIEAEIAREHLNALNGGEWSGSQCPTDPDNCWTDDATGEHVNAETGERTHDHPEVSH